MIESTLCYIEKDNMYLMLHRTKKEIDCNKGKWIGVGGKLETGETAAECLLREVREETGIVLDSYQPRGIITFTSDIWESERMYLFTADYPAGFKKKGAAENKKEAVKGGKKLPVSDEGTAGDCGEEELPECSEGELRWVSREDIPQLNLWEGDRIFLELLRIDEPFFFMELDYEGDELVRSTVGGQNFFEKVYEQVARIPKGCVSTYGEIAMLAGHPGAARAVGNVLHNNPYCSVIPCHRVVNSRGCLAPDFAFGGPEEQKHLLEAEGVEVIDNRVVKMREGY